MKKTVFLLLSVLLLFSLPQNGNAQNSSVLATGNWYKLAVPSAGVYKIDYNMLSDLGIAPNTVNPKNIHIYSNGGKLLPQSLSESRPDDLIENAIFVKGEEDGTFDTDDYILFYGTSPDRLTYNETTETFDFENNYFEDQTYYFITVNNQAGKRVQEQASIDNTFPTLTTFDDVLVINENKENTLTSGREWYGDRYNTTTEFTYDFEIEHLSSNGTTKITSAVMAQSYATSSFDISLNGQSLGSQSIAGVSTYEYGNRGHDAVDVFPVSNSVAGNDNGKISVKVKYNKNNSGKSLGFLNYLLLHCEKTLTLDNEDQIQFKSIKSLDNPFVNYSIANTNANTFIWDITDAQNVQKQSAPHSNSITSFGAESMSIKSYVVFNPDEVSQKPTILKQVENQNLHAYSGVELLIVTSAEFRSEANRLAQFRQSHNGYNVSVVTPEEIFNEYSGGSQDVTAIRDFAKALYNQGSLKHLLLFGKCSYDYKDIINSNTNFVPTYQSRNSLHPLKTYSSDDYFGFLEDHEGEWEESLAGDHTLDIGVGRLPLKTIEEAASVVDKLIGYDNAKTLGRWKNKVIFVADDGDNNLHQDQSNQLVIHVDTTYKDFDTERLFLDNYEQIPKPGGEVSPATNHAIDEAINNGALVVNFTGHGGESGWTQEAILDNFMIEKWDNGNKLPLFVTATCEFGRHDDPRRVSGGENTILHDKGGAVAIVTTARPVNASSNFELNKAFYEAIFSRDTNGEYLTLGDIMIHTKNNSLNGSANRNFSLLGDPSMRLNYPEEKIQITSINSTATSSTYETLSALEKVKIKGIITDNNAINALFNGDLDIVLYDKQITKRTLGNENTPFAFDEWQNVIFKGKSTVKDGVFAFDFVMPKNIAYEIGTGRLSLYATNQDLTQDAHGADISIPIGGSADSQSAVDNTPPSITLYLNDSTFRNGDQTGESALLLARLSDESGINTSMNNITNNIIATLDNDEQFVLNNYYTANKDTYQSGWVVFPINDLEKGKHTITFTASDTYNNTTTTSIEFWVNQSNGIKITALSNVPNPVVDYTEFIVNHNRAGEAIEVEFSIYSQQGAVVASITKTIEQSSTNQTIFEWDGTTSNGKKLLPGIYVYGLVVRSLSDGSKNQRFQKLVLVK